MINKAILLGRVGCDPEIKQFAGGKLAFFSLATSEKWKDKNGENKQSTEWHNITIYGNLVDIVEKYITKGQLLYLEGKIVTTSWEKDGQKHSKTNIHLNSFNCVLKMIGNKTENKPENIIEDNDDLPF